MRRRGKTPKAQQGRGSPMPEEQKGPLAKSKGKPEARATDKGMQGSWGREGGGESPRTGRPRGFPTARRQGPCIPRVPGPRSSSTCCRACMPRSANHPPAQGVAAPCPPSAPPGPHLLVGCGELLSDHGTGLSLLTRDRDATGGASSEMSPLPLDPL